MARGINTINGIDYVYEYKSHWNAELHRSEQKRDYIGKVKDGVFVPNRIYQMRMELEALKRQNGLPADTDERPLEDELAELIRKHTEHKAKLAEKKSEVREETPVEKVVTEPVVKPVAEPEVVTPVEPEPVREESTVVVETPVVEEAPVSKEEPVAEPEPVGKEKPAPRKKHVLRVGELDDEEFGPDLFNVQPSVAPVEDEPEEEIIVVEEEEDEDPDLFAFSEDVEKFLDDEEKTAAAEPVAEDVTEPVVDVEPVVEETPVAEAEPAVEEVAPIEEPAPVEEKVEEVAEEPLKEAKTVKKKTRKEKKEEDNGQLFLF